MTIQLPNNVTNFLELVCYDNTVTQGLFTIMFVVAVGLILFFRLHLNGRETTSAAVTSMMGIILMSLLFSGIDALIACNFFSSKWLIYEVAILFLLLIIRWIVAVSD